jgi:hypothetical protein
MFVNLETSDFRAALTNSSDEQWRAIAASILQANDRSVAIGKIADVLQLYAREQPVPADPMHATLYGLALARIDFYTLALEFTQSAEAHDPTLIKEAANDTDTLDADEAAA